jgi:oligopeptide/dipeptide ABC transporter ATP-binding protein
MSAPAPLLALDELRVQFDTDDGIVKAVDGVSLTIGEGETLAVVGESGSGKSVTSLAIMRLLAEGGRIAGGRILFGGDDLATMSEPRMQKIRGNRIAMIFQDPMTSLNPVYTIGDQIAEVIVLHQSRTSGQARAMAVELLELVGIPEPAARARAYPHQLSGGMRQRAMIAMALSCRPELLIADEPTTALDVTIQAQILDLIRRLQAEIGMAVLFITHDLGVVAEIADRVVVMYAGRAVEQAPVEALFARPRMPYTMALLDSIPRIGRFAEGGIERLEAIPGNVPNPLMLPPGCAFHPRCRYATAECAEREPVLEDGGGGHLVRCLRWRRLHELAPGRRASA